MKPGIRLFAVGFLLSLTAFEGSAQSFLPIQNTRVCTTQTGQPVFPPGYSAFSIPAGAAMRRHVLTSPDAICNDGTPAVVYVRKAVDGAREPDGGLADNRWVILFQGGGACLNYDVCVERWCGEGYYDASKMSSAYNPAGIAGTGIFSRDPANSLGNRNQVFAYYCSSDTWQGTKRNSAVVDPLDPTKGFTLNFMGGRIVDAIIADLENGVLDLPKLSSATDVIISGDSAGATGVRHNVDRIAARLRQKNPNVVVRAVLDATFNIVHEGRYGLPPGDPADPFTQLYSASYQKTQVDLIAGAGDESCLDFHTAQTDFLCARPDHLERHHLTTPFFQRQDLTDPKLAESLDANLFPTPASAGQAEHDQLAALPNLLTTAEERTAMTTAPGVIGNLCYQHVILEGTQGFLGKRLSGPAGAQYSFHDVLKNWLFGGGPSAVLPPRPPSEPANPVPDPLCQQGLTGALPLAIVSAATYERDVPLAPESLAIALGSGFVPALAVAPTDDWPTLLGSLRVTVTDAANVARQTQIYYVHPSQVAFLIPRGTALGNASVRITSESTDVTATVSIVAASPGIYTANQAGFGVVAGQSLRVAANGERTLSLVFDAKAQPIAVDLGAPSDQVYLILYGTGLRGATSGSLTVGGIRVPFTGPVAQGQYLGLDQLNLGPLPQRLKGAGDVLIGIRANGISANDIGVRIK